jgi:hypothetical protein
VSNGQLRHAATLGARAPPRTGRRGAFPRRLNE